MRRILAFIVILASGSATASTYYVKPGGNNASSGLSWSTAWQTVAKVNATMKGGDTCYFGPGTYKGPLIPVGGTVGDRTAYISGNGTTNGVLQGAAKLVGGDSLPSTGWSGGPNVYTRSYTMTNDFKSDGEFYVMAQNDSMLERVSSTPVSPGTFSYIGGVLSVYCYNISGIGTNPANYRMWTGTTPIIYWNVQGDYVTIDGFKVYYGEAAGIWLGHATASLTSHTTIAHCSIKYIGNLGQNNAACIRSDPNNSGDSTTYSHDNYLLADSMGFVTGTYGGGEAQQYGTDIYAQNNMVIESCWTGPHVDCGIYFKASSTPGNLGLCRQLVVRYNTIQGDASELYGIDVRCRIDSLYIYGNVFNLKGGRGIKYGCAEPGTYTHPTYITNNTIYYSGSGGGDIQIGEHGTPTQNVYVKYNILSGISDSILVLTSSDSYIRSDSNNLQSNALGFRTGAGNMSLTSWRAYATAGNPDIRSTTTNPLFLSPATGDFSRPSSAQEMNQTYSGRTWTRYGAWQPGGTVIITPLPLTSILLDSVRCDFSGENDSLRIRFKTQAQSGNDSVVLAISPTNALPTLTSTDRWAKAFVSAKTDTSFAIRSLTEPDTIIIGGWVRRGTLWSAGVYDTLILRTAGSAAKTLPLIFVQVDSIRSDFSGETDSLRFRFVTSSQTWPDSVVMALTTNSTLPIWSQTANRWVKPYRGASKFDSLYVTSAITETDTVIAAAWIKDNDSGYSAPAYFVFVLRRGLNCACTGTTGNVDGSADGSVDISDLLSLEFYLFNAISPSSICLQQANVDGSADKAVDVNDLTTLINYLFGTPGVAKLAPCQ